MRRIKIGTLAALLALVAASVLGLSGPRAAHADGTGELFVQAYSNAPGWITVSWTSDGEASEYTLWRQGNPNGWDVSWSGKYTDTNLTPGTWYSYRVCADSDCSDWVSARTLDETPPTGSGGTPSGTSNNPGGSTSSNPPPAPQGMALLVKPSQAKLTESTPSGALLSWTPATGPWTDLYVSCYDQAQPTSPCGFTNSAWLGPWQQATFSEGADAFFRTGALSTASQFRFSTLTTGHSYLLKVCVDFIAADKPLGDTTSNQYYCTPALTLDMQSRVQTPVGTTSGNATITLLSSQGTVVTSTPTDTSFTVSGSGFNPRHHVFVHLDSADGPSLGMAIVAVDGTFQQDLQGLARSQAGKHTLVAVDGTLQAQVTVTFDIPAGSPSPLAAPPRRP